LFFGGLAVSVAAVPFAVAALLAFSIITGADDETTNFLAIYAQLFVALPLLAMGAVLVLVGLLGVVISRARPSRPADRVINSAAMSREVGQFVADPQPTPMANGERGLVSAQSANRSRITRSGEKW
jgi:hypothetical protein